MSDLDVLIEQMTTDIHDHAIRLDDIRLRLFLNWLSAHNGKIKTDAAMLREAGEDFKSALQTWLISLPVQGALWEYRLILEEITWWHQLDPQRLEMVQKSKAGQ